MSVGTRLHAATMAYAPGVDREDLVRQRREHVGRSALELTRYFEAETLRRLHARGHTTLTMGQKRVMPHLPVVGVRLTTLATRAGMSKQAMMKLVDGLEVQGYLERAADPRDGRAKIVRFTDRGRQLLDDGLAVIEEIEAELNEALGERRFKRLRADMAALVEALGVQMPDEA